MGQMMVNICCIDHVVWYHYVFMNVLCLHGDYLDDKKSTPFLHKLMGFFIMKKILNNVK